MEVMFVSQKYSGVWSNSISVSTLPYNVQLVNVYLSTATFDELEKDVGTGPNLENIWWQHHRQYILILIYNRGDNWGCTWSDRGHDGTLHWILILSAVEIIYHLLNAFLSLSSFSRATSTYDLFIAEFISMQFFVKKKNQLNVKRIDMCQILFRCHKNIWLYLIYLCQQIVPTFFSSGFCFLLWR